MPLDIISDFSSQNSQTPIAYTDLSFRDQNGVRKVDETVKRAVSQLLLQGENPIIIGIREEIELYRDIPGIKNHIIEIPERVEHEYAQKFEEATRGQKNLSYAAEIMTGKRQSDIVPEGVVAGNQTHTGLVLWSLFKQMGREHEDKKLSSHFIMSHPDHTFLLSDGGVSVDPTAKELADIVYYTVLSANHYGMPSKVALLDGGAHKTKMREAYEFAKDMLSKKGIDDVDWQVGASFKEAYENKSTVIIAPDLNTGNIGYKVAQRVEKYSDPESIDIGESHMHIFNSEHGKTAFVYSRDTLENTQENGEEKSQELVDAALRAIGHEIEKGVKPKVAFVSYSTAGKKKDKFQMYDIPARAAQLLRATIQEQGIDCDIEGDIQFDAAWIPEIANKKIKDRKSEFGDSPANIYIFPDRDSGNIACDIAAYARGSEAIGPIVDGCVLAANDLSRGAKVEDIIAMHHITKNMNKHTLSK